VINKKLHIRFRLAPPGPRLMTLNDHELL